MKSTFLWRRGRMDDRSGFRECVVISLAVRFLINLRLPGGDKIARWLLRWLNSGICWLEEFKSTFKSIKRSEKIWVVDYAGVCESCVSCCIIWGSKGIQESPRKISFSHARLTISWHSHRITPRDIKLTPRWWSSESRRTECWTATDGTKTHLISSFHSFFSFRCCFLACALWLKVFVALWLCECV